MPDSDTLSPARVIRLMVDAVVRNGNVLINMSPDPDGDIPATQAATLRALGAWMRVNCASVQDTRPGPYQPVDGVYGATVNGRYVYLHILAWPQDRLRLPPLPQRIVSASRLDGGKVHVEQTDGGVTVELVAAERDPVDTVIRLENGRSCDASVPIGAEPARQANELVRYRATWRKRQCYDRRFR